MSRCHSWCEPTRCSIEATNSRFMAHDVSERSPARSHARPGYHALISGCGKRCATFRDEDVWGCWRFAQELAQCPAFPGGYRMQAGIPALGPATCNRPVVRSMSSHRNATSSTVAVGNQDGCDVPCPDRFCLAASMSRSTSRSVRYSYFDEAVNIINPYRHNKLETTRSRSRGRICTVFSFSLGAR
jgi:hypothetical protein